MCREQEFFKIPLGGARVRMTTTILRTLAETQPWAQLSGWAVPQRTDLPTCTFPLTSLSFWRQQVYSITLTFSWTLTNAQTPT